MQVPSNVYRVLAAPGAQTTGVFCTALYPHLRLATRRRKSVVKVSAPVARRSVSSMPSCTISSSSTQLCNVCASAASCVVYASCVHTPRTGHHIRAGVSCIPAESNKGQQPRAAQAEAQTPTLPLCGIRMFATRCFCFGRNDSTHTPTHCWLPCQRE